MSDTNQSEFLDSEFHNTCLEIVDVLQKMDPDKREKALALIRHMVSGDALGREIVGGINSGEIRPEDALDRLDEHQVSSH